MALGVNTFCDRDGMTYEQWVETLGKIAYALEQYSENHGWHDDPRVEEGIGLYHKYWYTLWD